MTQTGFCTRCGAGLVEGNCPACLLQLGLSGALPAVLPRRSRRWIPVVLVAIGIAALLALLFLRAPRASPRRQMLQLSILPPPQTEIGALAVAPDGHAVVFAGISPDRETRLWVRRLDSVDATVLAGTEGAAFPFWSPDSQRLGFFADGVLKQVQANGSWIQRICDAPNARGGSWGHDGSIVFAARNNLLRVASTGGSPQPVLKPDHPGSPRWPWFLPGDNQVLFTLRGPRPDDAGIYVADLKSGERKRLLSELSNAAYTDRHLLFARGGMLMAQPYDAARHRLMGDAYVISEQVGYAGSRMYAAFSAAPGVVVLGQWGRQLEDQLTWFDRAGRKLATEGDPAFHSLPLLSPDERHLLMTHPGGQVESDLWLHDLARGVVSRFTFDQRSCCGVWSPDGRRIAFVSQGPEGASIFQKAANSGDSGSLLLQTAAESRTTSWSPDGRYLMYQALDPKSGWDLWVLPLSGDRKPRPAFETAPFAQQNGVFSPDGRWIAYDSDESGRREVFVRAFDSDLGKMQVSVNGGSHPRWGRGGRELFFLSTAQQIMALQFQPGRLDQPQPLIHADLPKPSAGFDVSGNGERFLIPSRIDDRQRDRGVTLLWNWLRVPPN